MVQRFKEIGHPVFTSVSALSRNADTWNTQFLFRIIHSANQLSIYGAVSSWCEEFALKPNEREPTSEKFAVKEDSTNKEELKCV